MPHLAEPGLAQPPRVLLLAVAGATARIDQHVEREQRAGPRPGLIRPQQEVLNRHAAALLQPMEERYHCRSTIMTTNLVYDEWHNFLGNKSMVDALLSRARRAPRHYCHTVTIDGPSLRELQG